MIKHRRFKDGTLVFYQGSAYYTIEGELDPDSMMQVYFRRSSRQESIPLIVNRVGKELLIMKRKAEKAGRPFLFSPECISQIEMQFSELVQNAVLHAPKNGKKMVSVNVICFPEGCILLGITDSLGPIKLSSWKLDVTDSEDIYLGTNRRGLFIATLFGSRVVYVDHPSDPDKELMLIAEPDLKKRR